MPLIISVIIFIILLIFTNIFSAFIGAAIFMILYLTLYNYAFFGGFVKSNLQVYFRARNIGKEHSEAAKFMIDIRYQKNPSMAQYYYDVFINTPQNTIGKVDQLEYILCQMMFYESRIDILRLSTEKYLSKCQTFNDQFIKTSRKFVEYKIYN